MNTISHIPHRDRINTHKLDYLKAINHAMGFPWQAEDGKPLDAIKQRLIEECQTLSKLPYWVFTNCCTDSLQIAISVLSNPTDEIWIPAYGWIAVANAPLWINRKVELVDVDPFTGNISIEALKTKLVNQPAPKVLIIIHNFGAVVDLAPYADLAKEYGFFIIEDSAPSFYMNDGGNIPGIYSDITCYSFDFTKSPGTLGSGGALATKHKEYYDKFVCIAAHGKSNAHFNTLGTKSILDTTSASVLLTDIALIKFNKYREKRRLIADYYKNNISFDNNNQNNFIWERYVVTVPKDKRDFYLNKLEENKILSKSMIKLPLSRSEHINKQVLLNVEEFHNTTIFLPTHHFLTDSDIERIVSIFK